MSLNAYLTLSLTCTLTQALNSKCLLNRPPAIEMSGNGTFPNPWGVTCLCLAHERKHTCLKVAHWKGSSPWLKALQVSPYVIRARINYLTNLLVELSLFEKSEKWWTMVTIPSLWRPMASLDGTRKFQFQAASNAMCTTFVEWVISLTRRRQSR